MSTSVFAGGMLQGWLGCVGGVGDDFENLFGDGLWCDFKCRSWVGRGLVVDGAETGSGFYFGLGRVVAERHAEDGAGGGEAGA